MKTAMAAAIVIACASAAPALAQDDLSISIRPFVFGSVQLFIETAAPGNGNASVKQPR